MKPILSLDFDGVCHSYTSPWQATEIIPDPPVPGMWQFLERCLPHFTIAIFSSRSADSRGIAAMRAWFVAHADSAYRQDIARKWLHFPTEKPPAFLTLDDRGLLFTGEWPDPAALLDFKPWNKA